MFIRITVFIIIKEMFNEDYHHDTHEFLIWLLNEINEIL